MVLDLLVAQITANAEKSYSSANSFMNPWTAAMTFDSPITALFTRVTYSGRTSDRSMSAKGMSDIRQWPRS